MKREEKERDGASIRTGSCLHFLPDASQHFLSMSEMLYSLVSQTMAAVE